MIRLLLCGYPQVKIVSAVLVMPIALAVDWHHINSSILLLAQLGHPLSSSWLIFLQGVREKHFTLLQFAHFVAQSLVNRKTSPHKQLVCFLLTSERASNLCRLKQERLSQFERNPS